MLLDDADEDCELFQVKDLRAGSRALGYGSKRRDNLNCMVTEEIVTLRKEGLYLREERYTLETLSLEDGHDGLYDFMVLSA